MQKVCDIQEMEIVANDFAKKLKRGDVVCLFGNIGSGKTTFAKAMLKALFVDQVVTSPTFNIMQTYSNRDINISHFDLYRIKHEDELLYIGIPDVFNDLNIVIIEWPEIILNQLPNNAVRIYISFLPDHGKRLVKIIDN